MATDDEAPSVAASVRDRLSDFRNTLADYATEGVINVEKTLSPHYDCPECSATSPVDEYERDPTGVVYSICCPECGAAVAFETAGERRGYRSEELATDGGSKYVNATGPGYAGVWKVHHSALLQIPIGTYEFLPWLSTTDVWFEVTDHGVAVVDEEPDEPLAEARIVKNGEGPSIHVQPEIVREVGFQPGEDVRGYRYENGLELVSADPDPYVHGGGA